MGQGEALTPVDPVADAVALVRDGLARVLDARLWARSDGQSRALVVATAELVATAQVAYLAAIRDLDARPEAVAGARAGEVAKTFLAYRVHAASATADAAAAKAIDPHDGLLPLMGAALTAGEASRGERGAEDRRLPHP